MKVTKGMFIPNLVWWIILSILIIQTISIAIHIVQDKKLKDKIAMLENNLMACNGGREVK